MQNQLEKPSETFCRLLEEWYQTDNQIIKRTIDGHQYKKTRVVKGTVVVDIFWYPLTDIMHRDWYDISISSINGDAKFIGSLNEFGNYAQIFGEILWLGGVTSTSAPTKV